MASESIIVEDFDSWRKIVLNRPRKLNSLDASMKEALRESLAQASEDARIRAVLITGSGRGFCAGQDLEERGVRADKGPADLGRSLREGYNPLISLLATMPKPVVCAVNGVAAGAGANLALACDFVVAAQSAKFVQAFCNIGLVPDSGGTWLLPRLIGLARARRLAMLGEAIDAATAEQWGLIHQCVADDRLAAAGEQLATKLSAAPTATLGRIKHLLLASSTSSLEQQLELEAAAQAEAGLSKDYAEGVEAFAGKRKPVFVGE